MNDDLELQYESAVKLNEDSIKLLKEELLAKVMQYEDKVRHYSKKVSNFFV